MDPVEAMVKVAPFGAAGGLIGSVVGHKIGEYIRKKRQQNKTK